MSPCRGATAPLLRLPPLCPHVSLPSSASHMMVIPSGGRLPGAEGCLATPFNALTVSSCSRSSLEQAAGGCPACFPCLLPLDRLDVLGQNGASPSCPYTCRRHRTSRADAGATSTASPWSGDGNRAGKEREPGGKPDRSCRLPRLSPCTCRRARKSSSPVEGSAASKVRVPHSSSSQETLLEAHLVCRNLSGFGNEVVPSRARCNSPHGGDKEPASPITEQLDR